jgi:S1-C subfamily serine protease
MANYLVDFSDELAAATERVSRSIVALQGRRGSGVSGIVWRDNLIVTASAGIRAEEGIPVLLPDGSTTTARLRGRDSGSDLAVLEIDGGGLPALAAAGNAALRVGQIVLAVGRTGNTGPIASLGVVSGVSGEWKSWRGGRLDPFIRLDVSMYSALSGAAAVDASGNLIGMVSTGLSRSSVFAVSGTTIDRVAGKLVEKGYISRGFLGVALQPVRLPQAVKEKLGQDTGIMLLAIEPEGPAAVGGLILGDVLVSADGHSLAEPDALGEFLERTPAGQVVKFHVLRAGVLQERDVQVGERPSRRR